MTPTGQLTSLHSFCTSPNCADGATPRGMLIQAASGKLYGTTFSGGSDPGGGTIYEITLTGKLTTFYNFCSQTNCIDGATPIAGLVKGTDGNFYGTTWQGGSTQASFCGSNGCGTVFEITPAGTLTTLYGFCPSPQQNCTDGAYPIAGLMQATNGTFYGLADRGGADYQGCLVGGGCGDFFSLSMGLGPFVETIPPAGKVGRGIIILGNSLTGTTSVTFNGTPATFKVISGTLIEARVPAGATSGTIEVTTPGGTLKSNEVFQVLP
jgi:uncharacterized repeat protein (TIGR03803 family)